MCMGYRAYLELTFLSASDLKRCWFSGYQTEAIAWIDPSFKKSTGLTSSGGCNVQWQEKMVIPLIDNDTLAQHGKWLTIEIRALSPLGVNHHLLGTANISLAELVVDLQEQPNSIQTYQLVQPSGKRYGSVSFLGNIVGPVSSGSSATFSSASTVRPLHPFDARAQSKLLDQPFMHSFVETLKEETSFVSSLNYPPVCLTEEFNKGGCHHDQSSKYASYGMSFYPSYTSTVDSPPPFVYPPVYPSPNHPGAGAPTPYSEGVTLYSGFSTKLSNPSHGHYDTELETYAPSLECSCNIPHNLVSPHASQTLYPYSAYLSSVYPPHPPPEYDNHVPHPLY